MPVEQTEAAQSEDQELTTLAAEQSASTADPSTDTDQSAVDSDQQEPQATDDPQPEAGTEEAAGDTEGQQDAPTAEEATGHPETEKRKAQLAGQVKELLDARRKLQEDVTRLRAPVAGALRAGQPSQQTSDQPSATQQALHAKIVELNQLRQAGNEEAYSQEYANYLRLELQNNREQARTEALQAYRDEVIREKQFDQVIEKHTEKLAKLNSKFGFIKSQDGGKLTYDPKSPLVITALALAQERGLSGAQLTPAAELELLQDAALELATGNTSLAQAALHQAQTQNKQTARRTGLEAGTRSGAGSTAPASKLAQLRKAAEASVDGSESWDAYYEELIRLRSK